MGYSAGSAAVLDDTGRVVAHQRTITLDAEIEAADAEAMVAAIADLRSQVESVQAFNVCVDNSTVAALDRNLCTADLHGQMELGDGGATWQAVKITVSGECVSAVGVVSWSTHVSFELSSDSLRTRKTSGRVQTVGASAESVAINGLPGVGPFIRQQPEPGYTLAYQYEADRDDVNCTFSMTEVQLYEPYPAEGIYGGEYTFGRSEDPHNRAVETHTYNFWGSGALQYVSDCIDAMRNSGSLYTVDFQYTAYQRQEVQARITCLLGRTSDLLEMTESITEGRSGNLLEELRCPGTAPVLIQPAQCAYQYEQSGRAIGLGLYPQPPAPRFPSANYASAPSITRNRLSALERETTWRYTFLLVAPTANVLPTEPPSSPTFY